MDKRDDIWRSTLKEQFDHFEAETERDLWPAIKEQLETKRVPFYLWKSTWLVAASVAMLLGLVWMLNQATPPEQTPLVQNSDVNAPSESVSPSPQTFPADTDMAGADLMPTLPDPKLIQQMERERHEKLYGEPDQKGEMAVESSLPPNRIIRQVGPMQPLTPQSIQHQMERPEPTKNLAVAQPAAQPITAETPTTVVAEQAPTPAPARPTPTPTARGEKQTLNLNDLTLGDALSFASHELGKLVKSPVEVKTEETEEKEVRTYNFNLLNLRITRKIRK